MRKKKSLNQSIRLQKFVPKKTPEEYMWLAIQLALKAQGQTSPNPLVGALIVKNATIVGRGFHSQAGTPHAEINALREAGNKAQGAELYLNLEPCSHFGRTPPCVDAIIQKKIMKVFVGMVDPNPLVRGKGIRRLKEAGIKVAIGILEKECRKLNEVFIKYITTKRPFVILKAAASLDGRVAAESGDSQWITNEKSREYVHRLRGAVDAVLVGIGTVKKDDPLLTCRLKNRKEKDPIRIVVDSTLSISPKAKVLNLNSQALTIIATTPKASIKKRALLEKKGARVLVIPSQDRVDLRLLMETLGKEEITSVLIEGGSEINTSALQSGIVDKVLFFYAPKIIGGQKSPLMVAGKGIARVKDALVLHNITTQRFGDDVMIEGYIKQDFQKN
ncbi:MAG: bifunctional diaminohydroxyphosphoribosylaminopyrimidine deaminase/5-amino-6-(5-phosphoribosylamino)uracil reductase RibD [Thermodesulfobacteriota bacterium]|nr:MAG: bifunctional diaminohydroxyphosphoribosylaminopyrimidine deaminase/5-amino-6-(5-phosphoribosylamino)uracil reductase RibD [Thermodesulfobacteriota bacterium]